MGHFHKGSKNTAVRWGIATPKVMRAGRWLGKVHRKAVEHVTELGEENTKKVPKTLK